MKKKMKTITLVTIGNLWEVFEALFSKTCGLNVLLFKRFKKNWTNINMEAYEPCKDARLNALNLAALKIDTVKFAVVAL